MQCTMCGCTKLEPGEAFCGECGHPASTHVGGSVLGGFEIVLKDVGPQKIAVIKFVRELAALELKETKELVESAPAMIKKVATKAEAADAKIKLEQLGAKVEII